MASKIELFDGYESSTAITIDDIDLEVVPSQLDNVLVQKNNVGNSCWVFFGIALATAIIMLVIKLFFRNV